MCHFHGYRTLPEGIWKYMEIYGHDLLTCAFFNYYISERETFFSIEQYTKEKKCQLRHSYLRMTICISKCIYILYIYIHITACNI